MRPVGIFLIWELLKTRDRARLVSALVRKGFSYDAVYRVMGECDESDVQQF